MCIIVQLCSLPGGELPRRFNAVMQILFYTEYKVDVSFFFSPSQVLPKK